MNAVIEENFRYHGPTVRSGPTLAAVRHKAKEFAQLIDESLPATAGREKASAISKCEEAMFWACAGITRHSES